MNAETGLPALFAERRLAQLGAGVNLAARQTLLKLEAEMAGGKTENFESLLIRAAELDPKFVEAHLRLAAYYGGPAIRARAIERFRRVLDVAPNHVAH